MNQAVFRYLAISDRSVCPEPVPRRIRRLMTMGVPAVQIRDKPVDDRTRFGWIQSLAPYSDRLVINSRADMAVLGNLAGVHRARDALDGGTLRSLMEERSLLGVSTHSRNEVREARRMGADYVTFGPIFPTPSKSEQPADQRPGLDGLHRVCEEFDLPVLALGGVTPSRVNACREAGAYGAAGIRALFAPEDPAESWATIRNALPPDTSP